MPEPAGPARVGTEEPPVDLADALDRVGEIAATIASPHAFAVDRDGSWPAATLGALQQAGLGGLVVPQQYGGSGHGLYATARVCEILARECASAALCFGMHLVGSAVIAAKATAEQHREYLIPIVEGRHLTTLALSEPASGAHFYLPQTQMFARGEEGYRVTGTKSFVTNGGHADSYVISTVAADPGAPPGQFSCAVIPSRAPGLTWGEPWNGLGLRGNSSTSLELSDVPVPLSHLLGQPGDQIWYAFEVVAPYFLMAMAGTYLGVAASAVEQTRQHLLSRVYGHTGAPLGRQSLLQHGLGRLWSRTEATRRLVYHAAAMGDAGAPDALPAILSAKAEVGDTAVEVTNGAMTIAGGIAYRENARLSRCLRDARAAHVMSPTTELLRIWAGRDLLGLPLLSEWE